MEKIFFVYVLTFSNEKVYVGMSSAKDKPGILNRLKQHRNAAKKGKDLPIYKAWRKHGEPSFSIVSIFDNRDDCANAEISMINSMNSTNIDFGYNLTSGGEGMHCEKGSAMYELMRKKVWDNEERRRKVSDTHKRLGIMPPRLAVENSLKARDNDEHKTKLRLIMADPERRKLQSESARMQMANGGAEYLSKLFKGRKSPISKEGMVIAKEKRKAWAKTEAGRAAIMKGAETLKRPDVIEKSRKGMDEWRASDRNKQQCKEMAKKSAQACSIRVMDNETGIIYNSQKEAAEKLGTNKTQIYRWVKSGKFTKVEKL